jgi:hypothetical protein
VNNVIDFHGAIISINPLVTHPENLTLDASPGGQLKDGDTPNPTFGIDFAFTRLPRVLYLIPGEKSDQTLLRH